VGEKRWGRQTVKKNGYHQKLGQFGGWKIRGENENSQTLDTSCAVSVGPLAKPGRLKNSETDGERVGWKTTCYGPATRFRKVQGN